MSQILSCIKNKDSKNIIFFYVPTYVNSRIDDIVTGMESTTAAVNKKYFGILSLLWFL